MFGKVGQRGNMYCFIISYNRLTWLKEIVAQCQRLRLIPVIIDNNSNYKPLLDYLETTTVTNHRLTNNLGHLTFWKNEIYKKYSNINRYFVTDNDLDLGSLPDNTIEVFNNKLDKEPSNIVKIGASLKLNDLPSNSYTEEIISWETKFWENKDNDNFFIANVDTTFALYDHNRLLPWIESGDIEKFFLAKRANEPYTVRHLPWYMTPESMDSEFISYIKSASGQYWTNKFLHHFNIDVLSL